MRPLLLLDRDGVVNERPTPPERYILNIEDLRIRKKVVKEIVRIQKFALIAFISNQQCIDKKMITFKEVSKINEEINRNLVECGGLPVDFFVCPHLADAACVCRKPKPGLLLQAINRFQNGDKKACIFVGDQTSDAEAAARAGVRFRLVKDEQSVIATLAAMELSDFYKKEKNTKLR